MIQASFTGGPLDGEVRELDIAFVQIDVCKPLDDSEIVLFLNVQPNAGYYVYDLGDSDYSTYANYTVQDLSGRDEVIVDADIWTAAGDHFDVYSIGEGVAVLVNDDEIDFEALGVKVRLAKREGENN